VTIAFGEWWAMPTLRSLEIQNLIGREELRTQKFTRRQGKQKEVDDRKNQGGRITDNLSLIPI